MSEIQQTKTPFANFWETLQTRAQLSSANWRYWVIGGMAVTGLGLIMLFIYLYLADQPNIRIDNLQPEYKVGDTVQLTIQASDNRSLRNVTFRIEGSAVARNWAIDRQKHTQHVVEIATWHWPPGVYDYVVTVSDDVGNTAEQQGQLQLLQLPAGVTTRIPGLVPPPAVETVVLPQTVELDTDTPVTIELFTPRTLRLAEFEISALSLLQSHQLSSENAARHVFEFNLSGIEPGDYTYFLRLIDHEHRDAYYLGNLTLVDKQHPVAALKFEQPDRNTVTYQIEVTDNHALEAVIFAIENQADVRQVWRPAGESQVVSAGEIDVSRWLGGVYQGVIEAADVTGNEIRVAAQLTLQAPDTSIQAASMQIASVDLRSVHTPVVAIGTELQALLRECEDHMREKRYTSTSQTVASRGTQTALACYRQVQRIDANNAEAGEAFAVMAAFYRDQIKRALSREHCRQATSLMNSLRRVGSLTAADQKLVPQVERCGRPAPRLNCDCAVLSKKIKDWSLGSGPTLDLSAQERICQQTVCR